MQGTTTASFGAGITVATLTVNSATTATASLNIDAAAAPGARNVTLTTGAEVVTLTNGFTVTAGSVPAITLVSPNTGQQGQQGVSVNITGQNTHWVQGTTIASFAPGVSVQTLTVNSATAAIAVLNIAANAAVQGYTLTMNTGNEAPSLSNALSVTGLPVVTQVTPATVTQGQGSVSITSITGQFTHWVQGTTTASFGTGITVPTLTITSPTTATATINVAAGATIGLHTVTMTTGGEQALLTNGFGVTQAAAPPSVSISAPTDGATITGPTTVTGTVASTILKSWTLEYKMVTDNFFLPLATNTTPVSNAALGTFDPSLLLNGLYTIQLRATDLNNVTSSTSISVAVGSNQKVGNFSVTFLDFTMQLPGFNINILRTYDTRNQSMGDFGFGWTLSLKSVTASENRHVGDATNRNDWQQTQSGGIFGSWCIGPLKPHILTITMPDGKVFKFQPAVVAPTNGCQSIVPIDGGTSALLRFQGPTRRSPRQQTSSGSIRHPVRELWTMALLSMILTSPPCTWCCRMEALITSASQAVCKMQWTPTGDTLTIGVGGITHSSGKSVTFVRDAQQRITQITDPNGNKLHYAYDLNGNLVSFQDRQSNTTTYTYNATHDC